MKRITGRQFLSLLMTMVLLCALLAGLSVSAGAASTTGTFVYEVEDMLIDPETNKAYIEGWVYDSSCSSSTVRVINECNGASCSTNVSRADVNAAYGITGTHGFSLEFGIDTENTGFELRLTFQTDSNTYCAFQDTFKISVKGANTVSFDANGGTDAPDSYSKVKGVSLKLPSKIPTRTGYTFQGWSTTKEGDVSYAPGSRYRDNADLTLYAVWEADTYSVTYDANEGSSAPAGQVKIFGTDLTITDSVPVRDGYTFQGWSTTKDGDVLYESGSLYSDDADITLYAVWKLDIYDVKYDANEGYNAPAGQIKTYGVDLTITSSVPARAGYAFQGWATSADGSVVYNSGDIYKDNKAITLYAVWLQNQWKVTYNANGGGSAPASQTKYYGETLTLSSTLPERNGYVFRGWATSADGTVAYAAGAEYTQDAILTLYAVWEPDSYDGPVPELSIADAEAVVGEEVTVAISLDGCTETYGCSFTLAYDSERLNVKSYEFLCEGAVAVCNPAYGEEAGKMRFSVSSASAFEEEGNLVEITFETLEEGAAELETSDLQCFDKYGRAIEGVTEGKASISLIGDEKTVDITIRNNTGSSSPAEITAPEGGWVEGENTFSVTAENACVVLVSNDGGETYERLTAISNGDGGYDFTAEDVSADTIITVVRKGDISGDGKLSALEARQVLMASANKYSLTPLQKMVADLDNDGKITALEARRLLMASANKFTITW